MLHKLHINIAITTYIKELVVFSKINVFLFSCNLVVKITGFLFTRFLVYDITIPYYMYISIRCHLFDVSGGFKCHMYEGCIQKEPYLSDITINCDKITLSSRNLRLNRY